MVLRIWYLLSAQYLRPLHILALQAPFAYHLLFMEEKLCIYLLNGQGYFGDWNQTTWNSAYRSRRGRQVATSKLTIIIKKPMSNPHLMVHCHTCYDGLMDSVRVHAKDSFGVIPAGHTIRRQYGSILGNELRPSLTISEIVASIGPETRCSWNGSWKES